MNGHGSGLKWFFYALGVVLVWILETMVFNRLTPFGVVPLLLPLAGAAVALWEGPVPGEAFGLCLGVVADAVYPGTPGGMTLGLALLGCLVGLLAENGVRQNFFGYLLCAAICMLLLDGVRVLWGAVSGLGPIGALALVGVKEAGWSLCFTVLVYPIFKLIHRKAGGSRT